MSLGHLFSFYFPTASLSLAASWEMGSLCLHQRQQETYAGAQRPRSNGAHGPITTGPVDSKREADWAHSTCSRLMTNLENRDCVSLLIMPHLVTYLLIPSLHFFCRYRTDQPLWSIGGEIRRTGKRQNHVRHADDVLSQTHRFMAGLHRYSHQSRPPRKCTVRFSQRPYPLIFSCLFSPSHFW